MRKATRNITTVLMLVSLTCSVIGIPLYQHICVEMGVVELFSTCSMHDKKTQVASCCDEQPPQPRKQKLDGVACCFEIDATKQVTDDFTGSSDNQTPALDVVSFTHTADPSNTSKCSLHTFLEDPSPPGEYAYILHSSFLI